MKLILPKTPEFEASSGHSTATWFWAVFLLIFFPNTYAQDADDSPTVLEEVIVTAQKREQNLMDVPLSLSAVMSQTLEDTGLTGVQDLAQLVPGLIFAETIGRQTTAPSIRGVAPFGFSDPTVVVMIDGYTSGFQRSGNNATLLDLERVEILRGPQATLYGRNAIGGVINYITKKPSNEFRGNLRLDAGTHDTVVAQGAISGPLIEDKLYAGLSLGYRKFGGDLDNTATGESDVNEEKDINARFNVRFTPTDKLEFNLTLDYSEADDAAGDPSHAYADTYVYGTPPTLLEVGQGLFDFNDYDRTIDQLDLGGFDREEGTGVLNITYDFGAVTLTSITGMSNQETSVRVPFNRLSTAPFGFDVQWDVESFSQELRLASNGDGRLHWLVGAYYFDNQRERTLFLDFGGPPLLFQNSLDEVENKALFANVEYQVTDRFTLTGGLRYDDEDRVQTELFSGESAESSGSELLPSISISFKPNDNMNVYGTISRGYHAGGPNELGSIAAGAPPTYAPEFLTNYEIGVKGSSPNIAFSYEVALFFMDWEDQQIFSSFDAFNRFIINAGSSEIWGVEASARFEPIEGLSLAASVSILDPEYKDFFNPIDALPYGLDPQLAGNQLVYSAKFSGSVSAQYVWPVGSGNWAMRLRADLSHVGKRPFDTTNLFMADPYTVLNLYAGVQNERFEIGLFGNNVTNELYLTGGFPPSAGFPPLATVGSASVFGARFRMRY